MFICGKFYCYLKHNIRLTTNFCILTDLPHQPENDESPKLWAREGFDTIFSWSSIIMGYQEQRLQQSYVEDAKVGKYCKNS